MARKISQEELKKVIKYDPETGYFYKLNRNKGLRSGFECGFGNRAISIGHESWPEHYLAFVYMLDEHPEKCSIIHLNGNPSDNRWYNLQHKKYNLTEIPEYSVWAGMRKRCYSTNHPDYPHWGGRGVVICDRWLESFENFYADMGPRPSDNHSIDRINTLGHYEPENCRWATAKTQSNNRYDNRIIDHNQMSKTLAQWSDYCGIPSRIIAMRVDKFGWPFAKAISLPTGKRGPKSKAEHTNWEASEESLFEWPKN